MNQFGFDERQWEAANAEAKGVLSGCARQRQMIPYSEFVTRIHSISIGAHDPQLAHFLKQISTDDSDAGRGMLTALVVHKPGDLQPGPGFFDLARRSGHDTSDVVKFWIEEVKRVFAAWND